MADIKITCPQCGKTIIVSEFIDTDSLICHFCGEKLKKHESISTKTKLSIQTHPIKEADIPADNIIRADETTPQIEKKKEKAKGKSIIIHSLVSWILFIIVGGIMWKMRYGNGLTQSHMKMLAQYGPFIVIGFHSIIVVTAWKVSVFQGILCLLVPFYSLYYLFIISDNFFMRAVVAGLLIGVGEDSLLSFQKIIVQMFNYIDHWIRTVVLE